MKDSIKSILNPVRILTVEDWERIAEIILESDHRCESKIIVRNNAFKLLSRFESLTKQALTKEMFVMSVDEIQSKVKDVKAAGNEVYYEDYRKAAQSKVWFKEFEMYSETEAMLAIKRGEIDTRVDCLKNEAFIQFSGSSPIYLRKCTVFDLIIELDRYNRTSPSKIQLEWTDNFLNELIK